MEIVCLGDSLTAGYNIAPDQGWVALLNAETPHTWHNSGVFGDTLSGMLARLYTQVIPSRPDMVLLMGGYNDLFLTGSSHSAKTGVMAGLHACIHAQIRPVLCVPPKAGPLPESWAAFSENSGDDRLVDDYLAWLRDLAASLHLRCVDFDRAFRQYEGPQALLQPDRLHQTALGHRLMADAVKGSGYFI